MNKQRQSGRKIIVSEFITLDGVFDADTMGEWLFPFQSIDLGEHIKKELSAAGASLIGRATYEGMAAYWPYQTNDETGIAERMNTLPKYVVSTTLERVEWNNSTLIKKNISTEIAKLKKERGADIVVGGSATLVRTLMEHGLVDEYRFTVFPIIFGRSRRFFQDGIDRAKLKLIQAKPFSLGVVLLRYEPA